MNVLNTISKRCGIRYGKTEYAAVVNSAKRQGIGLALSNARIEEARKLKLDVLFSDTAIPAISAI